MAKSDSFINVKTEFSSMFCKVCGVMRFGAFHPKKSVITLHRYQIARIEAIQTVSVCNSTKEYDVEHGHHFLKILSDKTVVSRFDEDVVKDEKETVSSTPVCYRDGERINATQKATKI